MGVIKKLLFRGEILEKPRHGNFFLDMEENIHIHYRDLRIELGRSEFEEICAAFGKQSAELLAVIREKNYQDGKLANANQEDVRIWTDSRLQTGVKYHPRRVSLEECSDGYHLHYRNCKFLIDAPDFRRLLRHLQSVDPDAPCASIYSEVMELLEANDLDCQLDAGNRPDEVLALSVAAYHLPKVREIFKLIGFTAEPGAVGVTRYLGSRLTVTVRADPRTAPRDYRRWRGLSRTERLADFLARQGTGMDVNLLNRIKCQVLDLYYALRDHHPAPVETDPLGWLYVPDSGRVIFPHDGAGRAGPDEARVLYKAWSALLDRLGLSFIKPGKVVYEARDQEEILRQVAASLRTVVAACPAVERIHLMGSALRREMGCYLAPFVHGPQAKLGSDIDILVEIHPEREKEIPSEWRLVNPDSSSGCAVYHITRIPLLRDTGEWSARHPNLPFTHHLVDAYLFFPSQGKDAQKEAFLRKFGALLFYDRVRDGEVKPCEPVTNMGERITELYTGFAGASVQSMRVATENLLYRVTATDKDAILKCFKVAGNYQSARVAEHARYEARFITALVARGVATAGVIPAIDGDVVTVEGLPALLYDRIDGEPQSRPEYPLDRICPALATIHRVQEQAPLDAPQSFLFEGTCLIWLPYFDIYRRDPALPANLIPTFDRLAPLAAPCLDPAWRQALFATSPALHCHGDVTPKNVIIDAAGTVRFFDFNNGFFGPRMIDVLDGGIEFSLADKYVDQADFARFDAFLTHYAAHFPFTAAERERLSDWLRLLGIVKFTKEIRVLLQRPREALRRKRALAIAGFLLDRSGS
ncbi:MAG: phosphotransferase [Magnetococcales bacterium]|nr:phosphotransferase [Magnetococcales bacterium]